jgi:hypothetical protein
LYLRPVALVVARRPGPAASAWWSPPLAPLPPAPLPLPLPLPPELVVVDDDSWLPAVACCCFVPPAGDETDHLAFPPATTSLRHQSHMPEPAEAGALSP